MEQGKTHATVVFLDEVRGFAPCVPRLRTH
jgi:hypothetical protein